MAARAIWKGVVTFAGEQVPVKLYSAVEAQGVHFRLLHEKDLVPVKQHMVDPESGEPVPYSEVERGYQTADGRFVVLTEDDLEALEPAPSRTIEVTRFVDPARLNHQWYDRPYYLGPDGEAAGEAYAALARALAARGKEGVARWTMRKKEYRGALRAEDGYLVLVTLRAAGEVVSAADLPRPAGRALDAKEKKMAEQLVAALAGEFDPADYRDTYRKRVLDLVEAKAKGATVAVARFRKKKAPDSLEQALAASLEAADQKKERKAG